MHFSTPTLLFLPLTCASVLNSITTRESSCSATHIFLAKGNNEPYPGRQGKLVTSICSGLDNCDYEDILFYNPVESGYCDSVFEGAANGIAQITAYNKRCPDTTLVVSGYSQGGHIVGDILGGGGGTFFQGCVQAPNAPLDINSAAGKKIAAVLIWASTRHTASQPYNVLSGVDGQGLFPRPESQLKVLTQWTSVLHDNCVSTDPICAGGDEVATHLNYFDIYTDSAAEWVKSQLSISSETSSTISSAVRSSTSTTVSSTSSSSSSASSAVSSSITASVTKGPETSTTASTTSVSSSATTSVTKEPESSTGTSTTPVSSSSTSTGAASATEAEILTTTSATPVTDSSASVSTAAAGTSTSSSNGAAYTGSSLGLLGLGVAGSLVVFL